MLSDVLDGCVTSIRYVKPNLASKTRTKTPERFFGGVEVLVPPFKMHGVLVRVNGESN